MPHTTTSNIRAYVYWKQSSVYAGENVECIITFRNVAATPGQEKELGSSSGTLLAPNGDMRARRSPRIGSIVGSRRSSTVQTRPDHARALSLTSTKSAGGRGHRPALSLNVVSASSRPPLHTAATSPAVRGHGRSLSIVTVGGDPGRDGRGQQTTHVGQRPVRNHMRSASLQFVPSPASSVEPNSRIAPSSRQLSPLSGLGTPLIVADDDDHKTTSQTVAPRPRQRVREASSDSRERRMAREGFNSDFQFPAQASPKPSSPKVERIRPLRTPASMHSGQGRARSPRDNDSLHGGFNNLNLVNRVMSETSGTSDTPRTSGEMYSTSNRSNETLMSELPPATPMETQSSPRPKHSRQSTQILISAPAPQVKQETIIMGSMQTLGHFILDGSLVNAAPFDEVKRKGVQSNGGVVGMERSKRSSGIFGALSWGSLGESLGGLLGGDDMSSLAQMKATAGSKTIPLLSTPQSLLFVDLTLAPGESRSFSYTFSLPRGLPPTHRGRAIKIDYHLCLAIQRPGEQTIRRLQVPFRVLGSYNARGEMLGHDLMSPYVLLQDTATCGSISPEASMATKTDAARDSKAHDQPLESGLEDFLRYTARLLEQTNDPDHGALLSPTSTSALPSPSASRQGSVVDQTPNNVKDSVDLAILRANQLRAPGSPQQAEGQSSNRFNIARSGQPVAVLNLLRPAYRLGEAVVGAISFTEPSHAATSASDIPTYAVNVELESAERVDSSLALRSSHSLYRVTRKVHASKTSNTAFARQISFSLPIPTSATPTFETTGVSLVWRLKIDFTTHRRTSTADEDSGSLWEVVGDDERGTTFMARETLTADAFEIAVPLKVYGVPSIESLSSIPEALVV